MFETILRRAIAWDDLEALQQQLVRKVLAHPGNAYLLASEPQPTFTYGRCADSSDLLWSHVECDSKKVAIRSATRGGKWTFHGSGQMLIYPILALNEFGYSKKSIRPFVNDFRDRIADALRGMQLPIETKEDPFGIYCGGKKLASFGMAMTRGVVSHGVAVYYEDQTRFFSGINPCGVCDQTFTSLRQLGVDAPWEQVIALILDSIKKGFNYEEKSLGCSLL